MIIRNHLAPKFSEMEKEMVKHIPPGGNWQNIPHTVPSQRLAQIRRSGGRTTYYGRLKFDKPSYTISTYFNRIGNGCHIHPEQDRLISIREGARLQSFKDSFIFVGSRTSQYKQIGNAVPPLLARAIAELIEPHIEHKSFIDLFAGAGGMSQGFTMQGFDLKGAIEIEKHYFDTFIFNHSEVPKNNLILGDITLEENKNKLINIGQKEKVGVVVGGPPCQGFSTAGWRDPEDSRNQLFKEFVDIVKQVRPEFFVMENVPGILSMRKGEAIKEIIQSFRELGYHVNEPIKLKAEEYGVPQRRRRVFVIGSLKDIKLSSPTILFSETDKSLPLPVTVHDAISDLPPLKPGESIESFDEINFTISPYAEFIHGKAEFKEFYSKSKAKA